MRKGKKEQTKSKHVTKIDAQFAELQKELQSIKRRLPAYKRDDIGWFDRLMGIDESNTL